MKQKLGWLWRWTKRVFLAVGALILILASAGAIYQYIATRRDAQKYQPRGKMVDVGGFKMHLQCAGEGAPTVVLENGLGAGTFGWSTVPQEIAKSNRVCSYDRAGMGWSETSPAGRGVNQINKELHDLLTNAGEQGPYVFAGHSIGGLYLQNYVNQYPQEVAGLVLIDSSHSQQPIRYGGNALLWLAGYIKVCAPIGIIRLQAGESANDSPERQELNAWKNSTKSLYATADEALAMKDSCQLLREKPMQLGDKPLIVLTKSLKTKPGDNEDTIRKNEVWQEMQTDLVSRSTNGKQIFAEKAGHNIQTDEPEAVINAIRQVVETTQK